MRRRLLLSPGQNSHLVEVARAAAPDEACGILLGREGAVVTRLIATENVAADRRNRFAIDAGELAAAIHLARESGERLLGFYHSHPRGPSRPSTADAAAAWRGASYVIVSLAGGRSELTSWRFDAGRFRREELRFLPAGEAA